MGRFAPHCHSERAYFIRPRNGARKTSAGKVSYRRLWKCAECRKPFSVLLGTVFERSQIPLSKWLMALFMMASNKNGVAAFEVQRTLGVTQKTASFMLHRIREAMKRGGPVESMRGIVVADETYFGGQFKFMHKSKIKNYTASRAGGPYDKTPVLSLVDADTGQVRSQVLPRVDGSNLRKAIAEQVDLPNTTLYTDRSADYNVVAKELAGHFTVDHQAGEYVNGEVSSNKAENYFSQLKRSIDGTHHHVSVEHLPRYLAEFDFRYSTRKMTDTGRMGMLVSQTAGRRLTYRATRAGA